MAKQQFRSIYGFKLKPSDMEKPSGTSLTVVDQTYTVRQLVERANEGFMPVQSRQAIWSENTSLDDEDLEKVSNMALADKQEIMEKTRERVESLTAELKNHKKVISDLHAKQAAQQEELTLGKLAQRMQQEKKPVIKKQETNN